MLPCIELGVVGECTDSTGERLKKLLAGNDNCGKSCVLSGENGTCHGELFTEPKSIVWKRVLLVNMIC